MSEVEQVPKKLEAMLAIIDTARQALQAVLGAPDAQIDRQLIDSVSKLASAHANLSRESLRWSEKLRKQAGSASLEDRKAGVVAFITDLPIGERNQVYEALIQFEATSSPGIQLKLN